MILRAARREADTTIAHQNRSNAMIRRRCGAILPNDLTIVMSVDVDKARRNQLSAGINFFRSPLEDFADLNDSAISYGDVGFELLAAASISHRATPDHQVKIVRHVASPISDLPNRFPQATIAAGSILHCSIR